MQTIKVIPNPYSAVDADGVPQGVVGLPGVRGAWIGAALDAEASKKTGKTRFYFPGATKNKARAKDEQEVEGLRVVTLSVSDTNVRTHIANAVLDGSLLAVDKAEAAKLGIVDDFKEAKEILAAEKDRALETFRAVKGDKSAALGEVPHEPTPADDDEKAEAPKAPAAGVRVTRTTTLHPSQEA